MAGRIAANIVDGCDDVEEAYCYLVNQIGKPILEPQAADMQLRLRPGARLARMRAEMTGVLEDCLRRMPEMQAELQAGTLAVY